MITHSEIRNPIISKLHAFMDVPVVLSNSAAAMQNYPYISYTVINPRIDENGTHMIEHLTKTENGETIYIKRYEKIIHQVYSFTCVSDDEDQAHNLLHSAVSFFDVHGIEKLKEDNIVIVGVSNVSNRDNFISIDYEFRKGFDVRIRVIEVTDVEDASYIDGSTSTNETEV